MKRRTVLHDVAHDTELVKVAATALGADLFLEGDLDVGDVVAVPAGAKDLVGEAQDHDVLDHLLAQVVIDSVDLFRFIGRSGSVAFWLDICACTWYNMWRMYEKK